MSNSTSSTEGVKHTPGPNLIAKIDDLVDTLNDCADDPMWADHAEISKVTLRYTAGLLHELAAIAKATGAQP